jgi:hypothetical protein
MQVVDLQRVEEPVGEFASQLRALDRRQVDQFRILGVVKVDHVLGEQVAEVHHAARDQYVTTGLRRQHRLEHRAGEVDIAGGADGHVALHVDCQEVARPDPQAHDRRRQLGEADLVSDDPVNDVAFLKPRFSTTDYAGLNLETLTLGLGQHIFTLGYPLIDTLGGGSVKLTSGDISSLTGVDAATSRADDPRYIQISAPVQSGNSGGPVIDDAGGVVGIVLTKTGMTAEREILQNVNFALKANYIGAGLAKLPQLARPKATTPRATMQANVAEVQSGVFMILVEEGGRTRNGR